MFILTSEKRTASQQRGQKDALNDGPCVPITLYILEWDGIEWTILTTIKLLAVSVHPNRSIIIILEVPLSLNIETSWASTTWPIL